MMDPSTWKHLNLLVKMNIIKSKTALVSWLGSWNRKRAFSKKLKKSQYYWTELGSVGPPHSKTNLLTSGCGEGNYSIVCRVPSKEKGQLMLKRPEPPNGFQGSVFFFFFKVEAFSFFFFFLRIFFLIN